MSNKIRLNKPMVHCITNPVTIYDCANILVAIGASPIMAHHIAEVEEITSKAAALVINMGATDDYAAIEKSVSMANTVGIPVVLDPVGCAASTYRREFAIKLLEQYHIDCLRGNYSEIMAIINDQCTASGLDNKLNVDDLSVDSIISYTKARKMLIYASGKIDYIFDGVSEEGENIVYKMQHGDPMLTTITGSGCMLSTLLGSALAVENSVNSLIWLSENYGTCARRAADKTKTAGGGSMTFHTYFIDEISRL